MKKQIKNKRVEIRLTEGQKANLLRASHSAGYNVTDFILMMCNISAQVLGSDAVNSNES